MSVDSVIPCIMKNAHLIPGGKQLPIMSVHIGISSSVQNHGFYAEVSWFRKKQLWVTGGPSFLIIPTLLTIQQETTHSLNGSVGWIFFSTVQQLFCANTASFWFATL